MSLFDNYNEIEKGLLDIYSNEFLMIGIPNAKKTAKDMLGKSIKESKGAGTYILPSNFGNIMLGEERAKDPRIEKVAEIFRRVLPQKRNEGVRDEDIKWWWNLNDVERYIMLNVDEFHKLALFISAIKNSKSTDREKAGDEAGRIVWEAHPIYTNGDPNIKPEKAPSGIKREDFPLPIELKDRINCYIEKKAKSNPEGIKQEFKKFSTFNAFVRKEIKVGNI